MSLDANETVNRFNNLSEEDTVLAAQIGQTLLRQGEINKAKAILEKQPDELTDAASLLNIGTLKLSLNDVSGIINLEQALDASENSERLSSTQVEVTLAQAYLATGGFEKALEIAKRWQNSEDNKVQGYLLAANVYQRQGEISKAQNQYQQALTIYPDNANLQLALINLEPMDTTEKREQAFIKVDALVKENPKFLQAIVQHFMLSKWLAKEETMSQHLTQLIANDIENSAPYKIALGKMYMLDNKTKQAISTFESINSEQPQAFWGDLANAYVSSGQFTEAKQLYTRWFDEEPNNPVATAGMMKVHSSQGNYNSALDIANHYLDTLGGNNLEVRLLQTQLFIQMKQFDKAQQALASYPDNVKSLPFYKGLLGQIQVHNKQYAAAIENLMAAYRATPSPRTTHYLANAITNIQGAQSALAFLQKHADAQPNDQLNILRYAQMLTGQNNDQARIYYHKVLDVNPNHYVANNNLANLYLMNNEIDKAREYARKALDLRPENVDVLDTMASIETKLGNQKQALKHLNQAFDKLKQQPNDVIFYNYVKALVENSEMQLLKRRLTQYEITDTTINEQVNKLLAEHGIEKS